MTEQSWTGELRKAAASYLGRFADAGELRAAWKPWEELSERVREFLSRENLKELDGKEVYHRVVSLFEDRPRIRGRFKALVSFQEGDKLREALLRLVTAREKGDRGRRIEALGLGGLGRATASEILCLWWPYRFLPQNTLTCRALAKLVPVYRKSDITALPYDSFMDLAGTLLEPFTEEAGRKAPDFSESLVEKRFLYFYAFLSDLK